MKILEYLARQGPANAYAIRTKSDAGTQPTILTAVRELEKEGLILMVERNRKARGGKPSRYYELSKWGLVTLIARYDQKPPLNFQHLAQKYLELYPQVLSLWPAIIRAGIEDLAKKKLQSSFRKLHDHLSYVWSLDPNEITEDMHEAFIEHEDYLDYLLESYTDDFLDPWLRAGEDKNMTAYYRWIRGIKQEATLREVTVDSIQRKVEHCLSHYGEVLIGLGGRVQIPDDLLQVWGYEVRSASH
jgi:DNA-binding PadR family transcriptional regulator